MLDILKLLGFSLLFLRFSYWVGSSLTITDVKWKRILVSQLCEGLLLFFIFSQFFAKTSFLPMPQHIWVSVVGFVCIVVGSVSAYIAKKELGRAWVYAGVYTIVSKQQLVRSGIYSVIRHPIYMGFLLS